MQYQNLQGEAGVVIVYSPDFIMRGALEGLQRKTKEKEICMAENIGELFSFVTEKKTQSVILDISAHNHAYLLCAIRRQFPALPLIITRKRHLFSDYITAAWFGNIWLRDYDALMEERQDMVPTDCVSNISLSGPESTGACGHCCTGRTDGSQILHPLRLWLAHRLRGRVSSRKAVSVALEWLEMGGSAREMGASIARTDKLIYHYRWQIMRELGIRNTALEFIPSITVNAGPVPEGCSSECLMRACAGN